MQEELRPDDIEYLKSIPEAVEAAGMRGLDGVTRLLVVALISGGHVLLEGNPGLGKTALVKALSRALGLGPKAAGRIQFTPDLMPSDITGSEMPDSEDPRRLKFRPGPIFHEMLLADEINRATPKTQAAMLEAMAEFQVTVLGESHPLRRDESVGGLVTAPTPFMVMATQNPIDQDGTFDLPEAQLDRFLFKIRMRMPGAEVLDRIVEKELSADTASQAEPPGPDRAETLSRLGRIGRAVTGYAIPDAVRVHIANIVLASNGDFDELRGVSGERLEAIRELAGQVEYPFGTRAAIALARATLGWCACALVEPNRVAEVGTNARRALADVLVPSLRHRLRIWQDHASIERTPGAAADAADEFVRSLARAAAPDRRIGSDGADYDRRFDADLAASGERLRA